jgi:hypothetical protein
LRAEGTVVHGEELVVLSDLTPAAPLAPAEFFDLASPKWEVRDVDLARYNRGQH